MSASQAALYERRQSPAKPLGAKQDLLAYGKTVWSRPSSLRPSLADAASAPTGAVPVNFVRRGRPEGIRLPGEHGISRPNIAQGRPCVRPHLYAAVRSFCATSCAADRGCEVSTRPSLRPLFEGREAKSKTRAKSAARARRCAQLTMVEHVNHLNAPRAPDAISACTRVFDALWRTPSALRSNARALQRVRDTSANTRAIPTIVAGSHRSGKKNPLSTVARRILMNQPRLVHKRRPAAGLRSASRAWT
ncbi:hypothetical protein M2427_004606 [Bradyrhizobium sp. BR13661]|nr:hypothetical protein [Bradyrhizobium sp. BR13661]